MGLEHPVGLLGQLRILDPGVGKAFGDTGIESGVGVLVDGGALVEPLQVDGVDRTRRRQLRDELVSPGARRVELEPECWIEIEPAREPAPIDAGSPRRIETTKVTGRGSRPTTSASERPA